MIAPADVPSARFEALRCEVNYNFGSANSQECSKPSRAKQTLPDSLNLAGDSKEAPASHTYRLRDNPRRSRKAVVAQEEMDNLGPGLSSKPSTQVEPGRGSGEPEDTESLVSEAIADMTHLLDFAFRKLIGVKGSSPGLRTIKSVVSPSLIDIAPAVWDLQYLQVTLDVLLALDLANCGHRRWQYTRKLYHRLVQELPDWETLGLQASERKWTISLAVER